MYACISPGELANIVLAVLTAIYVVFAGWSAASAKAAAKSTEETARAQLWLEAQRIFRLTEFYDARKNIMIRERPLRADEWQADEAIARLVCRDMDQVAWLIKLRRFPSAIPKNIWEDAFSKTWIVLKLLVLNEQASRGPGDKWSAFAEVGEHSLKKLRWPAGWDKPEDELLRELGWAWEDVRAK